MAMARLVVIVACVYQLVVLTGAKKVGHSDAAQDDYDYEESSKDTKKSLDAFARFLKNVDGVEGEGESDNAETAGLSFNLSFSTSKPAAELEKDDLLVQRMKGIGAKLLFQASDVHDVQLSFEDEGHRRLSGSTETAHRVLAKYTAIVTSTQASIISETFQKNPPAFEEARDEFKEAFESSNVQVNISEASFATMISQVGFAAQQVLLDLGITSLPTSSPTPGPSTPSPTTAAYNATPLPTSQPTAVSSPTTLPTPAPTEETELVDAAQGISLAWAAFVAIALAAFP